MVTTLFMFDRVTEVLLPLIRKLTNLNVEIVLLVNAFQAKNRFPLQSTS